MKRALHIAGAIAILSVAAWLRMADLDVTPMQFDEATGARLAGWLMAGEVRPFNPVHFHGPLLARAGALSASLHGERGWSDLTQESLRRVSGLAGVLVVVLALAAFPLIGRTASLAAGAFLAVSPPLVHTSRLFLHEPLFGLFLAAAGLAASAWWIKPEIPRALATGLFLGLAAATRETFVLAPAAWFAAAVLLRMRPAASPGTAARHAALALAACALTTLVFYTDFLIRPVGFLDFLSTYWQYETAPGHGKPASYYALLFLAPEKHGRLLWWFGGVFVLGGISFLLPRKSAPGGAARFLFLAALLQSAVFSLISYKVPWLIFVPWMHFAAAAGLSVAAAWTERRWRIPVAVAAIAVLAFDAQQSARVAFRFASDDRNPLAYVPTVPGVQSWTARCVEWLRRTGTDGGPVAIIGKRYWPLPWYLRTLPHVGYWESLPEGVATMPLVIAMPESFDLASEALTNTHEVLYEGLRADTPVLVFVRKDLWKMVTE
jgi:uncharacterized protein (TIGR03663 family)